MPHCSFIHSFIHSVIFNEGVENNDSGQCAFRAPVLCWGRNKSTTYNTQSQNWAFQNSNLYVGCWKAKWNAEKKHLFHQRKEQICAKTQELMNLGYVLQLPLL